LRSGPSSSFLVVTRDSSLVSEIASALGDAGSLDADSVIASPRDIPARLRARPVTAVIVDLGPDPLAVLAGMTGVVDQLEGTRFIALGESRRDDLILEAMQVGFRHFLARSQIRDELGQVLDRLARSSRSPLRIVSLVSASGGCGSTTLAVNLAHELHLTAGAPVLLVDLDISYGAAGSYLGVQGPYGVADLLRDRDRVDGELIRSTAQTSSAGIDVLLSPAATRRPEPPVVEEERLSDVLEACRGTYDFVVVDAPRLPIAGAASLAKRSTVTFLVLQPRVKDVRAAETILTDLLALGVAPETVVPVVNRHRRRHEMVAAGEIRAALAGRDVRWIANDYRSALKSADLGRPLQSVAPRSRLRKEVMHLAREIANGGFGKGPASAR
jgi:pilus assembly protein CpaE